MDTGSSSPGDGAVDGQGDGNAPASAGANLMKIYAAEKIQPFWRFEYKKLRADKNKDMITVTLIAPCVPEDKSSWRIACA